MLFVVVLAALAMAAAAFAYSTNYVDNAYFGVGDTDWTSDQASRQYNKVWRPLYYEFCLTYGSTGCVTDALNNPFTDTRTAFYDYAGCWNTSGYDVSPVTCQTTHP